MGEQKNNTEKQIEEFLKQIVGSDIGDIDKSAKNPLHVSTVASTIEQYLTPFIIFGYDVNGDAVVISNSQSQRDQDSLMISVGRYMSQQRMGEMNDDIGDMLDE